MSKPRKIALSILVSLIIVLVLAILFSSPRKYPRPEYPQSAAVYQTVWRGSDDGTNTTYYIYKLSDDGSKDGYSYIKSVSDITIRGPGEERDVASGTIRSRDDLFELQSQIDKDTALQSRAFVIYMYQAGTSDEECKDMEELAGRLFP